MNTYRVKFYIKAIVEVEVKAESSDKAIEKAKEIMSKKKTFNTHLEYIDGKEELIGYDKQDAWEEIYP